MRINFIEEVPDLEHVPQVDDFLHEKLLELPTPYCSPLVTINLRDFLCPHYIHLLVSLQDITVRWVFVVLVVLQDRLLGVDAVARGLVADGVELGV